MIIEKSKERIYCEMYTVNIRFRVSAYNLTATVVHEHSTVGFLEHFITEVGPEI